MDNTQYFYRNAVFTRRNGQVALADINHPESTSPLDEWLGIVVSLADGQHTIQQLVDYMAGQYQNPPANLEKTLHSVIERLSDGNIVQLSKVVVSLPYYLSAPIEELDLGRAKQLMEEDGYTSNVQPH